MRAPAAKAVLSARLEGRSIFRSRRVARADSRSCRTRRVVAHREAFRGNGPECVYGSYVYRDLIWVTHFLAAFAVLAAVAGALVQGNSSWAQFWRLFWGLSELVTLLCVLGLIFASRHFALRDRWTACRLGAEQLRIARMALPLLVLPRALSTIPTSAAAATATEKWEFDARALEEVKRAVRDHGLPRRTDRLQPSEAAPWVHCIVADQIDYHHRNHESWSALKVGSLIAPRLLRYRAYRRRHAFVDS